MTSIGGEREIFIDPVSHEKLNRETSVGRSVYNGLAYHFTSRVNKDIFDEDPQLWISTPHASLTSVDLTPVDDE